MFLAPGASAPARLARFASVVPRARAASAPAPPRPRRARALARPSSLPGGPRGEAMVAARSSASASSAPVAAEGTPRRARVAVVGAGAAGLAAARELLLEGHDVVVFERSRDVGGVWVYDPRIEAGDDFVRRDPNRDRVHSSMYASLRTNLPREVMGYASFPFTRSFSGDARRFCGHREVRAYLDAYCDFHSLRPKIRFGVEVVSAEPLFPLDETSADEKKAASEENLSDLSTPEAIAARGGAWGPRWEVVTKPASDDETAAADHRAAEAEANVTESFDALVVCNGHYSEPRAPSLPGASTWPGAIAHSHDYREPSAYAGKSVVVLGAAASGEDVCRELATVAARVALASRGYAEPEPGDDPGDFPAESYPENVERKPGIVRLIAENSAVEFEDGSVLERVDRVLYATGYHYAFPFLDLGAEDTVDDKSPLRVALGSSDNRVAPLYEHVFPPSLAPSLAFVGLPWKVVPFPQFELQGRFVAKALAGTLARPWTREAWAAEAAGERAEADARGVASRHAHRMGEAQFAYNDRLSAWCDAAPLGAWRAEMYRATGRRKRAEPRTYRDGPDAPWSDEAAREEAREEARSLGFEVMERNACDERNA